jgi:octaprenyl-diphosphate synthase
MQFAQSVIEQELSTFDEHFKTYVKSDVPMLDRITRYIVKRKGKQLRPMFVLLSASLAGPVNESTYRAASLVELLHTATLVHDDVVDESLERRGFFSTYALWKAKVSVLVGDYLLAKGLLLSLDNNDFKILQIMSEAVRKMSEGELLQIEKSRTLNIQENTYFEIITNKTASLLASACAAGMYSTNPDPIQTERMRLFGEKTGIAFQIKDDLFDYGMDDVGKPTGNDIKEKKLTLPLIYTLQQVDKHSRKHIIRTIKNKSNDKQAVKEIIQLVTQTGGINYAAQKMHQYKDEAIQILQAFPDSPARKGLEELVSYTVERKY